MVRSAAPPSRNSGEARYAVPRLETLQVGLAVIYESHRACEDPMARLLGDQTVHLLGYAPGYAGWSLGTASQLDRCIASRAFICMT